MHLLTMLSLGYVIILVVALAVSLISILTYMVKIASALGSIKNGLLMVEGNTRPLAGHLNAINQGLTSVSDGFQLVDAHLEDSDRSLNAVGERLGIKQPAGR